MNYTIRVFFLTSIETQTYNAASLAQAKVIVDREVSRRFVRKVELFLLLETFIPRK